MKSLVTGANGFIGSAVTRALLDAGHDVRAMVRPESNTQNLIGLPIDIIEGDLRDNASLKNAVKNCSHLFHVAADYRLWVPDPDTMFEINVKGTRNIMLAAADAGVDKIIYTSSVATLGYTDNETTADENTPSTLSMMVGHYKRSKYLAEQEVQSLVNNHQIPVIIVNPSAPIGPRDIKPTPTGMIILNVLNGRMPAYVDTGLNIVHVDDVATGHILACKRGKPGERYILGGENMTLLHLLEIIAEAAGKTPPRLRLPHNLLLPIAWLMELWANISNKEPLATVDGIRMAKKKMYYSSQKAADELGYEFRPARNAIVEAIQWFVDNGYCK